MFEELMPLLTQRVLIVTLSRISDEQMCVNVIPKPLKSDRQNDDAALTTPLSVTGTPKELDEQLPGQLMEFVEAHLRLSSTLKNAKEQMEAAAKAARKPTNSKSHSGLSRSATSSPAKVQAEEGTKESSDDSQSSPELTHATTAGAGGGGLGASTGSLFDLESKSDG